MKTTNLLCIIFILPATVRAASNECRSVVVRTRSEVASKQEQPNLNLVNLIFEWRKKLLEMPRLGSGPQRAMLLGEISDYAAHLISQHRNEDFYYLAKNMAFPLNKRIYEDDTHFFNYGSSLLQVAILFKNYEIYKNLKNVPRLNSWSNDETPMINAWSGPLAKTVMEDSNFSKDALIIPFRGGPEFSPRIANYGKITPRALQKLKDVSESKDLLELNSALIDLFPSGTIAGHAIGSHGKKSAANVDFGHTGYEQKKDPFLQIAIRDSAEYHQGIFSWSSYYRTKTQFNLQLYDYRSNPSGFSGEYHPLEKGKKNWIREMKVENNRVRILIERDNSGKFYDRGTSFQELTLYFREDGQITQIQIRNGNLILGRALWTSQTVELAENSSSFSNVYIKGEEDLSTMKMGK